MKESIKSAQRALKTEEVRQAAQVLAKYGLGILIPHMHDEKTGEILPLPTNMISCERDLVVSFKRIDHLEVDMVPVAWRWGANGFEICASCCGAGGPING